MKVLVTGCYGFIGNHVSRLLIERGHTVVGMDRLVEPRSEKGERVRALASSGMKYVEGTITSRTRCREIMHGARFDAVVHLAGQFPVKHDQKGVDSYIDSNVKGWINVAETVVAARVPRMIYASSVAVSDSRKPGSLYGATKAFNEHAAHVYSKMGPDMVGLRFGPTYGPMMRKDAGLYKVLAAQFTGTVGGGGIFAKKHPLIFIHDAAETVVRFVEAGPLPEKHSIHLVAADDWFADFGDVIQEVAPHLGVTPVFPQGWTPVERTLRPDLKSLDQFLGWRPFTSLALGARPLAQWLLDQRR